jgi:hypothetical protein
MVTGKDLISHVQKSPISRWVFEKIQDRDNTIIRDRGETNPRINSQVKNLVTLFLEEYFLVVI